MACAHPQIIIMNKGATLGSCAQCTAEVMSLRGKWHRVTGHHQDGTPCCHTKSDCPEHGSCMDCDMCKILDECL